MKEYPILFSGEMVRAILDNRKTQTRRVVKMPPFDSSDESLEIYATINLDKCPYGQVGDRLWVRETWSDKTSDGIPHICYKANYSNADARECFKWKPSIHMPRIASRISLEITGVRVERLQKISEEDCLKEGIKDQSNIYFSGKNHYIKQVGNFPAPVDVFKDLWESINGKGSWDLNPWVWVIEFKKAERC